MLVRSSILKEFVSAVEKTFSKPEWVGFHPCGDVTYLYVGKDTKQVSLCVEGGFTDSDFAVEGSRFLAAIKAWSGEQIKFTQVKNKIQLDSVNTQAVFPVAEQTISWLDRGLATAVPAESFLTGFSSALLVPDIDARFGGIFLNPEPFGTVTCKLSHSIIYFTSTNTQLCSSSCTIPLFFGHLAKLKNPPSQILLRDTSFGFRFESGVEVTSSYLSNPCPEDFMQQVGIDFSEKGLNTTRFTFGCCFDVSTLKASLKLVSSTIGEEETGIKWEFTSPNMWKLSAKTCKNFSVEEQVSCSQAGGTLDNSFWLHKKGVLAALSVFDSEVYLFENNSVVVFTDNQQVILLSKLN